MSNINKVCEAILDSAAKEHLNINIQSTDSVEEYSYNGMDILLSSEESLEIWKRCLIWMGACEAGIATSIFWDQNIVIEDS